MKSARSVTITRARLRSSSTAGDQAIEQMRSLGFVVDKREDFFKLIEHQHQFDRRHRRAARD